MHSYLETCPEETDERSGAVVECLTRDRRAAGSSLTGICLDSPKKPIIGQVQETTLLAFANALGSAVVECLT